MLGGIEMHKFFEDTKKSCPLPFADLCMGSCIYRPYMNRKTYQRSEIIYPQGSKINYFGIVLDGILKAVSHTVNRMSFAMPILKRMIFFRSCSTFPERDITPIPWWLRKNPQWPGSLWRFWRKCWSGTTC